MIRCILGTTLRLAVYGSILNLALSFAGKTEGFWATKVCFPSCSALICSVLFCTLPWILFWRLIAAM